MNASYLPSVFCAVAMACAAHAHAAPASITMEPGQQKTWSLAKPIMRAATANADIVGINVVPPRGVIITAKKPGTAMVSIWSEGRSESPASQYLVKVVPTMPSAKQMLGKDGASAQVSIEGTRLRLSGELSSLEQHGAIEESLKQPADNDGRSMYSRLAGGNTERSAVIDTSTSKFDVQVRMDIKIVEVSRQKLNQAGFYYQRNNRSPFGVSGLSGPNNYLGFEKNDARYEFKTASGTVPFTDAFNIFSVSDNVWAAFSALEANGFAYSLAEPSLTALSGQTATFLAGGEVPVPYRSGTDGSVSIQYKEFGIRLMLTPTVLDDHRITIKVAPEVSEIDPSLGAQVGGLVMPGLRVRRTDTTVAIGDGETFVISGLVSRQSSAAVDKFPFLGDIPILGAFFRSNRFERDDKELLMIATPRLVRPFAKNAKLPPLPGQDISKYDPSFMHLFLKETGKFDPPDVGFSR